MKKNIIIYVHKHFCVEDVCEAFVDKGYEIHKISGQLNDRRVDKDFEERLKKLIDLAKP